MKREREPRRRWTCEAVAVVVVVVSLVVVFLDVVFLGVAFLLLDVAVVHRFSLFCI